MNIVILYGKVVSQIDFKFIYNRYNKKNTYTSIAQCEVMLENNSIITIYGYDDVADFMYRKLNKNVNILIEGAIGNNMMIKVESVLND